MANGIADDMLSTAVLAVTGPRLVAPAMNERMWLNPAVKANVRKLCRFGFGIVEPEYGPMACGGEGWGRLARLEAIVAAASRQWPVRRHILGRGALRMSTGTWTRTEIARAREEFQRGRRPPCRPSVRSAEGGGESGEAQVFDNLAN